MSHPDEGLIHSWLDGELDAAETARVEALVKSDPAWAAAAAEARGFIAASARILGRLDDVPANVVPATDASGAASAAGGNTNVTRLRESQTRGAPWWTMRVAALLVVAVGAVLVIQRAPRPDAAELAVSTLDKAPAVPSVVNDASPTAKVDATPKVAKEAVPTIGASAPARLAEAPAIGAGSKPKVSARTRGAAEAELKDSRAGAGGAATTAPTRSSEADVLGRSAAGGAAANVVSGAAAPSADRARRDAAEAVKSADEKRAPLVAAAPAANSATIGLRKEASSLALQSVVTTSVAAQDCFRETTQAAGSAPAVYRVRLTSDSTAVAIISGAPKTGGSQAGVSQVGALPSGQVQMRQMAAAPAPTLRLRGDTLFVGVVNGVSRVALRVSCLSP